MDTEKQTNHNKDLLVGQDTGVVYGEVFDGDKVNIVRKQALEYMAKVRETKSPIIKEQDRFVRLSETGIYILTQLDFTKNETKLLYTLILNMEYGTCRIYDIQSKSSLSRSDIRELVKDDMSDNTFDDAFNKLMDKGLLKGTQIKNSIYITSNSDKRSNVYFLNPFVFLKGDHYTNITTYELFKDSGYHIL